MTKSLRAEAAWEDTTRSRFRAASGRLRATMVENQNTDGRTEAGALRMWLTPHGFLKGAAANAPRRRWRRRMERT